MKILAFTGMPCSGKSVAVELAKERDIQVVRMGDAVWEETKKQGLSLSDEHVGFVATSMRERFGKDIWAKKTIEKIRHYDTNYIVIDGIRNKEEIELFKNKLGSNFVLIAIVASYETRKKRMLARKREDDDIQGDELKIRDERELGWGLGEVIKTADIEIINEGAVEEFQQALTEIFNTLYKSIS
ncbi:MAG: AAA family ATPase [Thermoplasmatota archaeon]